MNTVPGIAELLVKWEADAARMEDFADTRGAFLCRRFAAELSEVIRAQQDETLTLAEAALESGYSLDHLQHQIADGSLPNAGRKGAPRIRRGNLTIKSNRQRNGGPSPEAAAAGILAGLSVK